MKLKKSNTLSLCFDFWILRLQEYDIFSVVITQMDDGSGRDVRTGFFFFFF